MAKSRTIKRPLPAVGDAFAVPLSNGMWGGCRVIRVGYTGGASSPKPRAVQLAAVDWIGTTPPTGTEPGFTRLLRLTHHFFPGEVAAIWLGEWHPVPATFKPIAPVAAANDDLAGLLNAWSYHDYLPLQIEMQWRWDHDREAVLREDAAEREQKAQASEASRAEFYRNLDALTLPKLRAEKPFSEWRRLWPAAVVKRARAIFRSTIDELAALGPNPTLATALPILQACVEQFNVLDGTDDFVIETEEREDICKHFARMVHAAGITKYGSRDLTDQWRDW